MECDLPLETPDRESHPETLGSGDTFRGREPETVAGYGMANYANIFKNRFEEGKPRERTVMTLDAFAEMLAAAGVEKGMVRASNNTKTVEVVRAHPERFVGFALISPYDGVRGARELERLVREEGLVGLSMSP